MVLPRGSTHNNDKGKNQHQHRQFNFHDRIIKGISYRVSMALSGMHELVTVGTHQRFMVWFPNDVITSLQINYANQRHFSTAALKFIRGKREFLTSIF